MIDLIVYPWVLVLSPFILGSIWYYFFISKKKHNSSLPIPNSSPFRNKNHSIKVILAQISPLLKGIGIVFLVIALARPQKVDVKTSKNVDGIDIIIALDVSDSMLIEDMKPTNRMESAKETLNVFVDGRQFDRIGVVIFAGEAFTLVPLTLDYPLIKQRVSEITTARDAKIKDGTALGVALANAAGRLKESVAKTKVIIFLTDGENNSGTIDPETGLSIAKGFGLKIYSIAIGKSGPTRIPIYSRDIFGNKIKSYQPFVSTVNEDLLQKMANETGGKFYQAGEGQTLKDVFKEIDQLEKTKMDIKTYTKTTELFPYFLKIGFWILFLVLFIEFVWLRRWP